MSHQLSRVEKYSRQNKTKDNKQHQRGSTRRKSVSMVSHKENSEIKLEVEAILQPEVVTRTRQQRAQSQVDLEERTESESYSSRADMYPSSRVKWARWFYNFLLVSFLGLTVWLLWWGFHDSPWRMKQGY